jgi:hypothetical protein
LGGFVEGARKPYPHRLTLRETLGVGPSPATRERHSTLLAEAG